MPNTFSFFLIRYKKLVTNRILNDAFVELLEWDDYFALPETLAMDAKRIMALRDAVERMAVSTGVILLVTNPIITVLLAEFIYLAVY